VSRGLGNSWFPIRFLNRPELVVVRLRKQPD
jgi:predicted MPP superfamily phosphohydrolase